jgi:tetratricopeptide (TPR) repeat protein
MTRRIACLAPVLAAAVVGSIGAQKLADEPSHREALQRLRAGQELMSAEQFERAAEEFGKAIKQDPLISIAHYQLGQAYMNLRRYPSAIKAYKDCMDAMLQLYTLQQSNQFQAEKRRDDEIRELKTMLNTGKVAGALMSMSLEQHLRDLENQRSSMGGAFRPPADVLLALGSAHFRNGDREAAEAQWLAAIQANPKLAEAHNNIAVIYMQTNRLDRALEEVTLAEKAGFKVNPQFKADLKDKAKAAKR